MLTTELDCVYTQKLITLCNLENNGMTIMEVIGIIQKRIRLILRRHSNTGIILRGQQSFWNCRIVVPYKLHRQELPIGAM